jgi:hypothetical protein
MPKKILLIPLFLILTGSIIAGPYVWQSNSIYGPPPHPEDIIYQPTYLYGVEVDGNGRVWTGIYYSSYLQDRVIQVYDPITGVIDTIGPEIEGITGLDTINSSRGFAKLGDGNIAYADCENDKIRVFNTDDYSVIKESPSTDLNCTGGIAAFVYDGEQYFLSQQIVGSTVILWDADFNVVDTLTGGPGGRNFACTADGGVIASPTLGGDYFVEWVGNPDDGYVCDTVYLADLDVQIGGVMYISSGPNDYFWLMSRDEINEGVLVVDPLDDYDVKLSTYTDSSITDINFFSLGMVVDNQVMIWLENGVIDSSEYASTYQHQMLSAPCAVTYDFDSTTEYLYIVDYSSNSIKFFTRTQTSVWEYEYSISENGFILNNAYPNPFNPTTTIEYGIPERQHVTLQVFDITGRLVSTLVDEFHQAGQYSVKWDASKYSSGIYICRLESSYGTHSRKMLLIK